MHCNIFDITPVDVSMHYNEHLKFEFCHRVYNFITIGFYTDHQPQNFYKLP